MPADLNLTLLAFLMVLARVSGVFALAPLPGLTASPAPARIVLSILTTLALYPSWPHPSAVPLNAGNLLMAVLPEIALGIPIGLAVSWIMEAFTVAAQILSLNAGYAFAQTIDPSTQAESGVLLVFAQLSSGLVFWSLGLPREVLRALASSLEAHPAGAWIAPPAAEALLRLGGDMLALAVRLALPAIALLVLTDLALGLLGRLNAQLQLLTLAFPAKMMAALVVLGWISILLPRLMSGYAGQVFGTLRQVLRY